MMTDFNAAARSWDQNDIHVQRSKAIVENLLSRFPIQREISALEFGAGTGILSFMLADRFRKIVMMDSASEMVAVMQEKVAASGFENLHPLHLDITKNAYESETFDLVFSQMALHHVYDIQDILFRFNKLLNINGSLAIADLYTEDGYFHGNGFDGHLGFDVQELEGQMKIAGFHTIQTETCFNMQKGGQNYPIFLMIARK